MWLITLVFVKSDNECCVMFNRHIYRASINHLTTVMILLHEIICHTGCYQVIVDCVCTEVSLCCIIHVSRLLAMRAVGYL